MGAYRGSRDAGGSIFLGLPSAEHGARQSVARDPHRDARDHQQRAQVIRIRSLGWAVATTDNVPSR
jgi:hypothetical protein